MAPNTLKDKHNQRERQEKLSFVFFLENCLTLVAANFFTLPTHVHYTRNNKHGKREADVDMKHESKM